VMAGYWGDPSNTEKSFIDGWLRTGDLAHQDEEGYFFFLLDGSRTSSSRAAPILHPPELEEAIAAHLSVEACGVVGDPDPALGQVHSRLRRPQSLPRCHPVLRQRNSPAFVSTKLSPLKVPDRRTFVPELPRATLGKIDRKHLAAFSRSQL
jgi:acyl-coenzyme A synthetase/AMP-(fatty) acid ligase